MRAATIMFILLSIAPCALADPVDVPHQFQAGLPALAEQVNQNFEAVEASVDDNASRIASLETATQMTGPTVRVDGAVVGRYLAHGTGSIQVAAVAGGIERVAAAVALVTSGVLSVVSPTGYLFNLQTSDFDHPFLGEGQIAGFSLFFQTTDCTGSMHNPVQGETGFLSVFVPGTGRIQPLKPWAARQGLVFASPDPDDPNPVYMMRRDASVEAVPLQSFLVFAPALGTKFCVPMTNLDGYDPNNPQHVIHTTVPVEPLDAEAAGVSGLLGGAISVGL